MKIKRTKKQKTQKQKTQKQKTQKQKTQNQKTQKQKTQKQKTQKTIRIITIDTKYNDCKNDMIVYSDIFNKFGYKIDIHILDTNPKIHIKYATNLYYDINLFIDRIEPLDFKTKSIFPSGVNIFAPNVNTFQNYKALHHKNIDIVLCNTKECYNFINFIRKENNYKFKSYYTNFTTPIPLQLSMIKKNNSNTISNTKPMTFIHTADNQIFKNTGSLIHCWLKYNSNSLDCELHILCNGLCMTTLLLDIKKMHYYDLLNIYKFEKYKEQEKHSINTILKYKNLYLYLDLTPHDYKYKELIKNADVAICPSRKENYPHYINTARYFNIFVITMNHLPMTELIRNTDKYNKNSSGYLLQKSKVNKKYYKDTKYRFDEIYPNSEELRDSVLWCLEHSGDIRKYNNNNNGRKMFLDDKKYFENSIEKILEKENENNKKNQYEIKNRNDFNTLSTIFTKPNYKLYPENEDENYCKYINSRGFLKSCDIHSLTPVSSIHDLIGYDFDFNKLEDNKKESKSNKKSIIYSIYICNTAIPKFALKLKRELKNINCKFILVSGDSDDICPDDLFDDEIDFKNFIENDKIIHWYSQNYVNTTHDKISQMPVGLAYHHLYNEEIEEEAKKIVSPMKQEEVLNNIIQKSKKLNMPFWKRELKCYINFNFEKNYMHSRFGYDRYEALIKIPKNLSFSDKIEVNRTISWNNNSKYAFVLSPFGNGFDCHRTWEALILGCIPIVKTSGLDNLFEDLPVLIVQDWSDITEELFNKVIIDFKNKHKNGEFNYDKLTLKYWVDKINSHKFI
jgi:hypothetical protein